MKPRSELLTDLKEAQRLLGLAVQVAAGDPVKHVAILTDDEQAVVTKLLFCVRKLIDPSGRWLMGMWRRGGLKEIIEMMHGHGFEEYVWVRTPDGHEALVEACQVNPCAVEVLD